MSILQSLGLERPSWEVAPDLIGCRLETHIDALTTAVILTEVEAYDQTEPASHSFRGETARTATMFGPPGHLYVYRSYGVHWCANIATGPIGHGAGVLLRAGSPVEGRPTMEQRRGRSDHLTDGPGKLTQALGIGGHHDGLEISDGGPIRLQASESSHVTIATPRIGISRATELQWRFVAVEIA